MFAVASGVVSSVVKPAQAKHPGAIPKKCSSQIPQSSDSKEANMQQTRKTAETFSNILTVGNSKKKDSSHGSVPLDSNARHDQGRAKKCKDMFATFDQGIIDN